MSDAAGEEPEVSPVAETVEMPEAGEPAPGGWKSRLRRGLREHEDGRAESFAPDTPLLTSERYRLVRELGRGGMGAVLEAEDGLLGRQVALKILLKGASGEGRRRFRTEAEVASQLEHPHIVPVYDLGDEAEAGATYMAMRYVRGRALSAILQGLAGSEPETVREWSLRRLIDVVVAVTLAVEYAHSKGVVHRDIKPDNVMCGEFGEVFLMDFGLAKLLDVDDAPAASAPEAAKISGSPSLSEEGDILGTPVYMAPEQAAGRLGAVDERTDVYGLGALLYEALTLERPFSGRDVVSVLRKVREEPPVHPQRRAPARKIPAGLAAVALHCLAKDPAARYPSAAALLSDLRAFQEGRPVSVYRYPLSVRAWKLALRHRLVSAVAATVVLAGFVTAGAVGRSRYQLQSEQLARLERRQAALPYYFRGLDLLQRRLDPSTLREVALPALHDAVKTDPSFAEAWFALGEAHEALRNEDGKEAARAYLLALKLQPNNPHWLVRMGDLLRSAAQSRQSEANAKAAGYYRRAAAADPADPFAGIGLAYVRTQENRFDEAIAAADAATQKAPHLWEGWSALAYACSRKARQLGGRKWDEALVARAIPAYEEALRLSPGNRESLRGLAVCYKALGRHDEALELHAELLELDPGDYATYSNRGELYRQLGKLEQARRDLDKAVELAPTQTRLWENRSLVRKAQGDLDGALSDLDEALRLDPANGPAYTARGNIYRVRKQTEEAVADFSKAITYDPNNPIHLGNRGLVYFQTGRFDQARADLRKAIELDPAFEQGWANLGSAEQAAGDTQTAERVWSEGIAAVPSDARGHLLLYRGQLRLNDKRPKLAAEDLSLALQIGGKMAPLPKAGWLLLSRAYRESGQPKLAIATVHSGVAAGLPQQFARHVKYELGDSHAAHGAQLMKAGDPAGALRAYDEALRFDGNPKHAYRAALAALAAGDADAALKRLSKGYDLGLRDWRRLQKDEALKALWEDPRFKALLQRMGAPAPTPSPEGS